MCIYYKLLWEHNIALLIPFWGVLLYWTEGEKRFWIGCIYLGGLCIVSLMGGVGILGGEHGLDLKWFFVPVWLWFVENFLKTGALKDSFDLHSCFSKSVDLDL